jgi:hypothetical protein
LCDYDIASLVRGTDVRCPECGRLWSVAWLREGRELPRLPKGWVYAPLGVGLVGALLGWPVGFYLVWLTSGLCWGIAVGVMARPRHGDFAGVLASFLGPIAGIVWAAVCALVGAVVQSFMR